MMKVLFVATDAETAEVVSIETNRPRERDTCQFIRMTPVVPRVGEFLRVEPYQDSAIYKVTNVVYEFNDDRLTHVRVYIQLHSEAK